MSTLATPSELPVSIPAPRSASTCDRREARSMGTGVWASLLSLDGREVFFTRSGSIVAVDLDSLAERVVASFGSETQLAECSLSGDGEWITTAAKRNGKPGIVARLPKP